MRVAESLGGKAYAAAGLLTAGAAACFATVWLVAKSDVLPFSGSSAILRGAFVAGWICAGTFMWWRRPDNRLGMLVAGTGFIYATTSLFASADPVFHSLGRVAVVVYVLYFSYLALCFPADRLLTRRDRVLMTSFVTAMAVVWPLMLLFVGKLPPGGVFNDCGDRCPENGLQIADAPTGVADALKLLAALAAAAALLAIVIELVSKARSGVRLRRRSVEPVLYAFAVVVATYVANTILHPKGVGVNVLRATSAVASLLLPAAMLIGQARARAYAAASLSQLVVRTRGERVTPSRMQELLRDALGDPTLELALWDRLRSRFVDVAGNGVDLARTPGRSISPVTHGGEPIAALEHNSSLDDAAGVVDGLAETSLMLLENTRLVDELRASRARIVASADDERHRLERDLHDGAQQRLFLLQVKLARLRHRAGDVELETRIKEIEDDAAAALEELRVLAHGIYPTVLVERGVPEALRSFALVAPIPVQVIDHGVGRCSPIIEAAVYFCVLEAIQNAAKHGGAGTRVTIQLGRTGDGIDVKVADDGAGLGSPGDADGIGLTTMRDRIGAVGGDLTMMSEPGAGLTIDIVLPEAPLRAAAAAAEKPRWRSE